MVASNRKYLEEIFPQIPLGESYSLLECDFYDTHHRYFNQIDDNYLSAINMTAEDLILKYNFQWPEFYTNAALKAASTRSRPQEGINTWKDVNYEYLYYFGNSCSFLDTNGFKFFLTAAMYQYLTFPEKNYSFIDSFIYRLDSQLGKDHYVSNAPQKKFIELFLKDNT